MTYYKRNGAIVRVILRTEFCGRTYAVLQGVDESGTPYVHTLDASVLDGCPAATAEEWAAAEARGLKHTREERARAQRERDALAFGFVATATGGDRGNRSYSPRIVRVTKARYVDSTGGQWHRAGKVWNVGYQLGRGGNAYRLTQESIAAIEAACGGAAAYDFIAEGRKAGKVAP